MALSMVDQGCTRAPFPLHCAHCQVKKFLLVVQLLLGEVPERSVFRTEGFQVLLKPYLALTQVRRACGRGKL